MKSTEQSDDEVARECAGFIVQCHRGWLDIQEEWQRGDMNDAVRTAEFERRQKEVEEHLATLRKSARVFLKVPTVQATTKAGLRTVLAILTLNERH